MKDEYVKDEYYTKDLGEAAALLCSSQNLLRLDQEGNFYWFVFQGKSTCENLSNSYWFNALRVPAKAYSDSLKSLKERIFSRKGVSTR